MAISKEQQKELANMARRANRRLERATEGQRRALEYYLRGYTTREGKDGTVFKQGSAKTEAEYKKRMTELESFLGSKDDPRISTRTEWERVKRQNVELANIKLKEKGYDFTDDELAAILEEAAPKAENYYHILNIVQAFKDSLGGSLDDEEMIEALTTRISDYQLTLAAIKKRGGK